MIASMLSLSGECAFCHASAAALRCPDCESVFYCDVNHQRYHWPNHRFYCCNYKVTTYSRGQRVVALRDIKAGEIIVQETPLAVGPRHYLAGKAVCVGCFQVLDKYLNVCCAKCQWPACRQDCPGLNDEERHKSECKFLRLVKLVIKRSRMEALLPLRCLYLKHRDPAKWEVLRDIAKARTFLPDPALRDFHESITLLEEAVFEPLRKAAPELMVEDEILGTVRKLFTFLSAKSITPQSHVTRTNPLSAVYALTSRLEHSCTPNTHMIFEDIDSPEAIAGHWRGRVTLKARRNIRKGAPITTVFIDHHDCTLSRQENLLKLRNVRCLCVRCMDPTELGLHAGTLKCDRCPGWILPLDPAWIDCPWRCAGCKTYFSVEHVMETMKNLRAKAEKLSVDKISSTKEMEGFLATLQISLHPQHMLCMWAKHTLCKMYGYAPVKPGIRGISLQDLERKSALSRDVLKVLLNPVLHADEFYIAEIIMHKRLADAEILRRKNKAGCLQRGHAEIFKAEQETLIRRALSIVPDHHPNLDHESAELADFYATLLMWTYTK